MSLQDLIMLNEKIDELEAKLSRAEKIIKIQGEALELYGDGQYLKGDAENVIKNLAGPQLQVFIPGKRARQALKEVQEIRNESKIINAELG